jgi:AcrR family transcriptional regulator
VPNSESGLRATKKKHTRATILENAIALFLKHGIRATRSAQIAAASQVSAATLFNYFATKNDLAEAWVRGEIHTALEELARNQADRGIRPGLRASCRRLAESSCQQRSLRLEAWRTAGRAASESLGPIQPLVSFIEREQQRARLRADLPASALAEMLVEALEGGLIDGLRASGDASQVAARIRVRVDLVLDGARKRNERVAAPATVR